ncbi:MAG: hypothetical protein RL701_4597 [Pseudomonadota bacterium]|jgi:NAD+ diphosphatase
METDNQATFDRAAEKREDLSYLEDRLGDPETLLLPFWRGDVFTRDQELLLVRRAHADSWLDQSAEIVWLGLYAGKACFAVDLSPIQAPHALSGMTGGGPTQLRMLLGHMSQALVELTASARALLLWHDRHRFCSVCGQPSQPRRGGHLRVCNACRAEHFPRTDPCVLVLVCDGDRCLLGRSKGWPPGMYSALAGFVEPGETLEQAVGREVLEEVSVELGALRYAGSQPWPFPASLMVGFVAQARTFDIRVDTTELEAARWVTRDELRSPQAHGFFVPPPFAIAGKLIAAFTEGTLASPDATSA